MNNMMALFLIGILLNGCVFIGLSEDVDQLNAVVTITGNVETKEGSVERASTEPFVVTLIQPEEEEYTLRAYTVVYGMDDFLLLVPAGKYYLLAFEDSNKDFTLQKNERVGWHGSPSLVVADSGQIYQDMTIQLRDSGQAKEELPDLFIPGKTHRRVSLENTNLGEVVDKSVFKQELGPLGMWEPVKFHLQGHSGIYFLEPYDKHKTPVLFVHGISGSGYDWLYLIEQLDRELFQPWIVQYPSGLRLDLLSKSLSQSVNELHASYQFKTMGVVAHSMGGLVAKGFLNHQLSGGSKDIAFTTFVTISAPWLGHKAASHGVDSAPVAVPSWFDMVPGSPYLSALHEQPLPDQMKYYLLFSHKGKGGFFGNANSDGTVTLRSQLSPKAQQEAFKVIGFDEDHVSVLNSAVVSRRLNELLADEIDELGRSITIEN